MLMNKCSIRKKYREVLRRILGNEKSKTLSFKDFYEELDALDRVYLKSTLAFYDEPPVSYFLSVNPDVIIGTPEHMIMMSLSLLGTDSVYLTGLDCIVREDYDFIHLHAHVLDYYITKEPFHLNTKIVRDGLFRDVTYSTDLESAKDGDLVKWYVTEDITVDLVKIEIQEKMADLLGLSEEVTDSK